MMRFRRTFVVALTALGLGTVGGVLAQANDSLTRTDQAAFLALTCAYNDATSRNEITAALAGPGGAALAEGELSAVTVARAGGEPLPAEAVSAAPLDPRAPVNLVLVLDTTDTMPLDEIKGLLLDPNRGFLPDLLPEDQVSLVPVDSSVAGPTPFTTDKNSIYNDQVADLGVREGQNVIYEGIQAAVGATAPNSPTRQVILVITDSGYGSGERADDAEALVSDIITVAQASKAQIFPISFSSLNSQNVPDADLLNRLATDTGGVAWTHSGDKSVRAITDAVSTALQEFYGTLAQEVAISADLTGLDPDDTGFIPLDLSVALASGATLTSAVACPPPPVAGQEVVTPEFTIAFRNLVPDKLITEPLLVQVVAAPEPLPDGAIFRFFLDDNPTDSDTPEFTVDPAAIDPGAHTLGVQLRDSAGERLATTPTVTFYTQRALGLTTGEGGTVNLSGPLTLQVGNVSPNIGAVEFTMLDANDPTKTLSLGTAAPQDGTATLNVPNIQDAANTLLPGQTDGWNVQIVAQAAAASPDSPLLGVSNTLNLSVQAKPQDVVSQVFADPTTANQVVGIGAPILVTLLLIIVDFVIWGQIKKARIKKKINRPDGYDLSPNLMQLTVSRGGQRQTFVLTKKTMYVGRGTGNDISLDDDANVSRQHGVVMWRGQKWYYANRKPKVKARVNGKTLKGLAMVKLENPTEINIGDFQIVFHGSEMQRDISDLVKTNL